MSNILGGDYQKNFVRWLYLWQVPGDEKILGSCLNRIIKKESNTQDSLLEL